MTDQNFKISKINYTFVSWPLHVYKYKKLIDVFEGCLIFSSQSVVLYLWLILKLAWHLTVTHPECTNPNAAGRWLVRRWGQYWDCNTNTAVGSRPSPRRDYSSLLAVFTIQQNEHYLVREIIYSASCWWPCWRPRFSSACYSGAVEEMHSENLKHAPEAGRIILNTVVVSVYLIK